MSEQSKRKEFFLLRWFKRLFFGPARELSFLEEEALQSPLRLVMKNFWSRRISRVAVVLFGIILLIVVVGPRFLPVDLSYQDNTQIHAAPGYNMMKVPDELKGNLRMIAPGTTYGVGVDKQGKVHTWGHLRVTNVITLEDIPQEVLDADIVDVAAGYDHIAALDSAGKLHIWGNTRLDQAKLPNDIASAMAAGENLHFTQLEAGNQFSAAVTEDGRLFVWGNGNLNDIKVKKAYQENIQKVAISINTYFVLTKDGEAAYAGFQKNAFSTVPEAATSGVVDIAATGFTNAALKDTGEIIIWGNASRGERDIPEHEGKIIKIYGGRSHYTALTDRGELLSWGNNNFGQATVPQEDKADPIKDVYTGYYQNYAVHESGKVDTWGLRGYLLGTDQYGRDVLTRIVNGGQVTMTVGAVAVVISLIIGVVLGGLAGYFGGKVDMLIMRLAELVGSLPFLPLLLILSAILSAQVPRLEDRMYIIMVVLGLLSWTGLAYLVRAQILAQREMEYVTAAKALGVREGGIIFKHIIPNVISVIIVSATISFATSMLTESSLSYLGFGIVPPTPTWGNMLTGANDSIVIQQYWWRWVFPSLIFSICTICINIIGDGLRDAIDPKSNER